MAACEPSLLATHPAGSREQHRKRDRKGEEGLERVCLRREGGKGINNQIYSLLLWTKGSDGAHRMVYMRKTDRTAQQMDCLKQLATLLLTGIGDEISTQLVQSPVSACKT